MCRISHVKDNWGSLPTTAMSFWDQSVLIPWGKKVIGNW